MCSHMLLRTEVDLIARQKKGNEFTCRFCRCSSWQKKWARVGGRVRPQFFLCSPPQNKNKTNKITMDPTTRQTKTNRTGPDHSKTK